MKPQFRKSSALPAPILMNTMVGMAMKKAKRAIVFASASPTKPTRRQTMPRKISAKKGTVRERTVDMRCGQVT